ncbi:hypothetical protein ACFSTH_11440 [Paenibacillus yanchengensis]|uniref:Thioredoxin domain-containing protein n=1 Tax=Paenibacillus yanchengensis TaxID=2035833 RepID=A0ABW4YJD1_9BACL
MQTNNLTHRKFLKSHVEYDIGTYIPDEIKLIEGFPEENLEWLKNTEYGSILYFTSNNCTACNINVMIETYLKHNKFSYAFFCEGYTENDLQSIRSKYEELKIYAYNAKVIAEELKVRSVPFMLVLNKVGQVVAAGVVNTYEHSLEIMKPLLRSIDKKK